MKILLVLSILLVSCSISAPQDGVDSPMTQDKKMLKLIIPNANWEPIFFEEINERAKVAKLTNLRSTVLPNDDLELRVWIGFGLSPLEGFVIERTSGRWAAVHLRPIHRQLPRYSYQNTLTAPKSGWEQLWHRLVNEGVLTLPDSSELKDEVRVRDGESYVVEINMSKFYRTYRYGNPHLQKWPEAKGMVRIAEILYEEFGIKRRALSPH